MTVRLGDGRPGLSGRTGHFPRILCPARPVSPDCPVSPYLVTPDSPMSLVQKTAFPYSVDALNGIYFWRKMIIYSNKIIQFINEIKYTIKAVLSQEVCLKVHGDRFYNRLQTASYPIKVVIYNNKSMLGYFESDFYELGFHECLMHWGRDRLDDVIKHELAHYITFINHGAGVQPHGPEFTAFCHTMGWGKQVYAATSCLEDGQEGSAAEESSVFKGAETHGPNHQHQQTRSRTGYDQITAAPINAQY